MAAPATDLTCVPYNIWTLGGVTQAALDYLQVPGPPERLHIAGCLPPIRRPSDLGAYGSRCPVPRTAWGVVVGRGAAQGKAISDGLVLLPTFDLAGQGGPVHRVKGQLDVVEFFAKARAAASRTPVADLLSVSASYRYSDYSTGKKTNTYGLGAEWAPVRDYRMRGSYQHAVRHANITELFQPAGNNLLAWTSIPAAPRRRLRPSQCARSGVTTNYGNGILDSPAASQLPAGRHRDLEAEQRTAYTLVSCSRRSRSHTETSTGG